MKGAWATMWTGSPVFITGIPCYPADGVTGNAGYRKKHVQESTDFSVETHKMNVKQHFLFYDSLLIGVLFLSLLEPVNGGWRKSKLWKNKKNVS